MTVGTSRRSRRDEIINVATRLFSEQGYAATSLDDIAVVIGFTKPAIYYYFASKDEILFEIHDRIVREALERLRAISTGPGSPRERLEKALESHVRTVLANVAANRVFDRERPELSEDRSRSIARRDREYERLLRDLYGQGVAEGSLRPLEPAVAVGALLGALNWPHRWYRPQRGLSVDELVGQLLSLLAGGSEAPGSP